MGFFSGVGRVLAGVATGGLSEVANETTGGGLYGSGSNVLGLGDLLRGEKEAGVPDKMIALDPSLRKATEEARKGQFQGAGLYNKELTRLEGVDPNEIARLQQVKGEKALGAQSADEQRRAQQLVAQRGLNRSSVGLNAMINAGEGARDGVAELRSNQPLMQEQAALAKTQSVNAATGGLNSILNAQGASRDYMQGKTGGARSGGLLGLLGGAAGAYAAGSNGGNPMQGFQGGQALGQGLANF